MLMAVTRDVSSSLAHCELSFVGRSVIDVDLAIAQHDAYRAMLVALGCRVVELPAEDAQPDAVFVEDAAVVLDEIAVMTRPGAASRRGEVAAVARAVEPFRTLRRIEAPGTLDGGDVLRIGSTLYVGAGARSNSAGIAQLAACVREFGYSVTTVPTQGCLHLKSAVTQVADDTVLIQPSWVDASLFAHLRCIAVDPAEEHAANALRVGSCVIHPAAFERTRRRLQAAAIDVRVVDVSELQKAEGAVTCCSIIFTAIETSASPPAHA